jgi:hypothetical protein
MDREKKALENRPWRRQLSVMVGGGGGGRG